jgi:hypothetical protein
MVANAAGEFKPNKAIATATANSKKLDVPIRHAGPAIFFVNFIFLDMKKIFCYIV